MQSTYTTRQLVTDIWAYIKPRQADFWLGTICRIIADISWLYPAYAFAVIVDFFANYTVGKSLTPIYTAFSLLFLAILVRHVSIYFGKTRIYQLGERVSLDAQAKSLKHLMLLDMAWHEQESSGSKFKRIERGAASLEKLLRLWVNNAVEISINFVGIFVSLPTKTLKPRSRDPPPEK